ncbi:hypothetical protein FS837_011692 [Tulasnella sp. UAMH 9824]|nr:hypothetical protein FS837_011692 [Tulasnella sp. UAMH 9824]
MTYLDVIAQYDPIAVKWVIAETSLSRPELASILWTPMIFQLWTDDLHYAFTPYMTTGDADLFDILASSISKYGMAYTAPLMKSTAAFNVTTPQPVALGLYPVAPTLLLVGCLYIYSLTSLIIFSLSCTSNKLVIFVPRELTRKKEADKQRSALDVAQSWLTDPLPLIGSVFPGDDGQQVARSTESDPLRQVYDGDWGLVKVGIGLYKGTKGNMMFGLMGQSQSQTRRHDYVFSSLEEGTASLDKVPTDGDTTILPPPGDSLDDRSAVLMIPRDPSISDHPQDLVPLSSGPEVERSCSADGWLSAFHDPVENRGGILYALRNGSFAITEPSASEEFLLSQTQAGTLRILMFSSFASHLSSVASTILVTLLAYRAAAQWLHASENPDGVNITPIQYGLLVRTLGSGSLMSIINTLRYVRRSKRAKTPRFFKESLFSVTGIYLLTHVVGLVDLWLHSGARAVSVTRSIPIEVEALYGITYSDIKCGPFNRTKLPCQNLVQIYNGEISFAPNDGPVRAGYDAAISDVNPYLKSESINGTAILVPGAAKTYQSRDFDFHTHGLRVQCANLRDQCERLVAPPPQLLVRGGGPVTNCSKAGYPRIPYHTTGELSPSGFDTRNIETLVMGIIGEEMGGMSNGTEDFTSAWTSNPASTVVQIRWPNVTTYDAAEAPFVAYLNALDLYATCSLTYMDVLAHYDSTESEWSILEANLSSSELASVFWTPLMFQWGNDELLHALKPYVTDRGEQAIEMLENTLAKANMALVTGLMRFVPASNVTTPRLISLGLYPAAPTLLLITCLYIHSLAAIAIFLLGCTSNKRIIFVPRQLTRDGEREEERSALDVAQAWLTDPLPLIGSLFPGKDGREVARSVESDPLHHVYDSVWGLGKVGIGLYKWSTGDMIFGLMRQSHPRSRRYGRVFSAEDVEIVLQEKSPISGDAEIQPCCDKEGGTVPVD